MNQHLMRLALPVVLIVLLSCVSLGQEPASPSTGPNTGAGTANNAPYGPMLFLNFVGGIDDEGRLIAFQMRPTTVEEKFTRDATVKGKTLAVTLTRQVTMYDRVPSPLTLESVTVANLKGEKLSEDENRKALSKDTLVLQLFEPDAHLTPLQIERIKPDTLLLVIKQENVPAEAVSDAAPVQPTTDAEPPADGPAPVDRGRFPISEPPTLTFVSDLTVTGELTVFETFPVSVTELVKETIKDEQGQTKVVEKEVTVTQMQSTAVKSKLTKTPIVLLKEAAVRDGKHGDEITIEEAQRRIGKGACVLVSHQGLPDPRYLTIFRDDTLIIEQAGHGAYFPGEADFEVPAFPIDEALADLKNADAGVRAEAANHLYEIIYDRKAVELIRKAAPALAVAMKDEDASVRHASVAATRDFGPWAKAAVPALAEAIKDESIAHVAHLALRRIGPVGIAAVPVLVEVLQSESDADRLMAAETLLSIAPDQAAAALPKLRELLKSEEADLRSKAATVLAMIAPDQAQDAVPILLEKLKLKNQDIGLDADRIQAMHALGLAAPHVGTELVPSLIELMGQLTAREEQIFQVQVAAILVQLDPEQAAVAVPVLANGLFANFSVTTGFAAGALLPLTPEFADECRDKLLADLNSANPGFPVQYMLTPDRGILATMHLLKGNPDQVAQAQQAIVSALQNVAATERFQTLAEWGRSPRATRDLLPIVQEFTEDPDEHIKAATNTALASISKAKPITVAGPVKVSPEPAAGVPADNEAMPMPIETALPPPAPGEKRDPPSLTHPDPVLRRNAIHAIKMRSGFGDPIPVKSAVAELTPALKDSDAGVREAAASALGSMGRLAKPALPAMIANLKDPEFRVRYFTAVALRSMRAEAQDAIPALLEALQDSHAGVRVEAAEALVRIEESQKESVTPVLTAILGDQSQKTWIHLRAAQVLALADPNELKPFASLLATAMNHADVRMRIRAASVYGQIGEPEAKRAVTLLLDVLNQASGNPAPQPVGTSPQPASPVDWQTVQEAAQALASLGPQALPTLQSALKTGSDVTRQQIVGQSGAMGAAAIPLLTEALKDSNPNIRQQAMWSLAALGSQAKPALPAIREALRNPPKPATPQPNAPAAVGVGPDPRVMEVQLLMQIDPDGWRPEATKLLKDKDPQIRQQALNVFMFAGIKSPDAQQVVIESLRSEDNRRRSQALTALAPVGVGKEAIPDVAHALADAEPYARTAGFRFLSQFGPEAKQAVPVLVQALDKPETRYIAAEALAKIDPAKARSIVPTLVEKLASDKPAARVVAARTMLIVDPSKAKQVLPILIDVLEIDEADQLPSFYSGPAPDNLSEDGPTDPVSLGIALGSIGPVAKDAAPFVLALARHPQTFSFSRPALAESAAKLDPSLAKDAAAVLGELVYESSNPFLQADSAGTLVRLDPEQSQTAIPTLLDVLEHLNERGMGMEYKLASRVIAGLEQMNHADAAAALDTLQNGDHPQVAKLATEALARMSKSNTDATAAKAESTPDRSTPPAGEGSKRSSTARVTPAPVVAPAISKPTPQPLPEPHPSKAREFREQADLHYRRGKLEEALVAQQEAVRNDPEDPALAYVLAYFQHRVGRTEDAQQSVAIAKECEQKQRIPNWGLLMEKYQGPSRVWLEKARRD